ncbi:hypothetical protein ACLK1S_19800 [Escherichia coli]
MLPLAGYRRLSPVRAGLHQAGVDRGGPAQSDSVQGCVTAAGVAHSERATNGVCTISSGYAVEPADQRNRRIPLVRFESRLYKDLIRTIRQKETRAHGGVLLINACK